jgi:S-DNA-T family DNA segregation ATPase FtsK/SpoIIIE
VLVLQDDGRDLGAAILAAIGRLLSRYRSELAPVYIAVGVFVAGVWLHHVHPAWTPWLIVVTAVLGIGLAVVPARWFGWATIGPILDRPVERAYAVVVIGTIGGWLSAACDLGATARPLPTVAVVAGVECAVPWWVHRRRRAKAKVAREWADWPDLAEQAGLPGSRVLSIVVGKFGYVVRLALRKGHTAGQAIAAIAGIESALGLRVGSVRVEPEPKRADHVLVRVIETDPHAQPIQLPPHPQIGGASINKRLPLGLFEDGQPVGVLVKGRHVLIGGTTGAGKSGLVTVLLADLTECRDVAIWGVDLKGGMELGPWRGCLAALATTAREAVEVLRAGVIELNHRAELLATSGRRDWQPTSEHQALVIVIDEYAELPDEAKELADSIARRGRAVCVTLLVATQRPTQAAMGTATAIRSQMDVRICLRVRERRDVDLILGQGALHAGWVAHTLDQPGKFLISSPEHQIARPARGYLVTDEEVTRRAATNTPLRPPAPPSPTHASNNESGIDGSTRQGETAEPHTNLKHTEPAMASNPTLLLWDALVEADETGATIVELMDATGMGRTWVYDRLQDHLDTGRVIQPGRGRWRATPHPTNPGPDSDTAEPT